MAGKKHPLPIDLSTENKKAKKAESDDSDQANDSGYEFEQNEQTNDYLISKYSLEE